MNEEALFSLLSIGSIHANRLQLALRELEQHTLTPEHIAALSSNTDLLKTYELFTSRFAKLQDLLGSKLFPMTLTYSGENTEQFTMIDCVNRLEQLGVISDAYTWFTMREVRNHLTHEYPEEPGLMAEHLKKALALAPYLLETFVTLEKCVQEIQKKRSHMREI